MAYSITTKDGITLTDIPDDVPPDSPELRQRVSQIRAQRGTLEQPKEPETTAAGLGGAVTRGLAPVAGGAALGAMIGAPTGVGVVPGALAGAGAVTLAQMVGDPVVDAVNKLFGTSFTAPTQAIEELLTRAGVAQPRTPVERGVQATSAGVGGSLGTAAAGRTIEALAGQGAPVMREVGRMLGAQPATQAAGGAGAGLAAQAAQEAGLSPLVQTGAALAGGVAGAQAMLPRRAPVPGLAQTTQEATQRGIPVMTSDVMPPETFMSRTAQQMGERIPLVGTGPMRASQQEARVSAVRDLLRQYGAADAAGVSDDIMRDLATKRSADLNKYTGMKSEVINRLDALPVPTPNAIDAIDKEVVRLRNLQSAQYKPVIDVLEDWRVALQGLNQQGQNLPNIELLRKQFGEAFKAPELSSIRTTGEKSLAAIYGPLKQDMEDFITANGQRRDVTKWKLADKRLAEMAGELQMNTLKSVLRSGNATPEDVNKLLFSQKPSEIRQLYSDLTPAGRANARTAILSRAAQKAEFEDEAGTRMFSPERFNAELKRLRPQVGVFFQGSDLDQVMGLSRALNLTRRAGQAGVSTPTGQQAVPFIAGGMLVDLLGTQGAALASAGGVGLLARVYESAPVRNLMIRLGKVAPGSAEEASALKRLIATMQAEAQSIGESQE